MSKVVKVLHMAPLGSGGISKLTVTINGLIDLRKVKFDYLVFKDEKTFYEDIVYKYAAEKNLLMYLSIRINYCYIGRSISLHIKCF